MYGEVSHFDPGACSTWFVAPLWFLLEKSRVSHLFLAFMLSGTTLLKDLSNLILLRGQGGIRNLVVESDSTMALKMISEGVSITHPFAALVNSIRSYCDKGNFVADSLASGFA